MRVRVKLTLSMLGLLALLFGVGGSLLISLSFHASLERERELAFQTYQMTLGTLQIVGRAEGGWEGETLEQTLEQLYRQNAPGWAALAVSSEEERLCTLGAAELLDGAARPAAGRCIISYAAGRMGTRYLFLSGGVDAGEGALYLEAAHDISALYAARRAQQQTFLWVFAALALLCAVLAYTVSGLLTAPLEGLSRASRAIAAGEFSSRAPVRSEDEIGAVSRDFNTMAARMEETVEELRESVERQERFMGAFAHELKTPMTSIIGYADLLRGGTLSPEEGAEAADYIVTEGKRLERLSRKLLRLLALKGGGLTLTAASPAALVERIVGELTPIYAKENICLSCACEQGTCLLEPDLARSLVLNLLDNARKAMEGGGHIAVAAALLPDGCRITVEDDGRGVPEEALAHLTEAFYRADKARSRAQGGVGLGLTLCREIAALHGGSLTVENRPEGGVRVCAELRGGWP